MHTGSNVISARGMVVDGYWHATIVYACADACGTTLRILRACEENLWRNFWIEVGMLGVRID